LKNWKDYLLNKDATIRDAIAILEKNQCSVIVDTNEKLLGMVTDRDIRKALLNKISIDTSVSKVMKKNPTTLSFPLKPEEIRKKLGQKTFKQFPVVDLQNKIVGIHTNFELLNFKFPNPIVLMAGGLGSRLSPLTDSCPKPLLKIGRKTVMETIIESFIEHGFNNFYISVNFQSEMIENFFQDGRQWGISIQYLREKEALGTAGSLALIENIIKSPLIVMNADLLTKLNFRKLLEFHKEHSSPVTMCIREYDFQIPYGVVKTNGSFASELEEKPVKKYFVNAGVYVINPEILNIIPKNKFYNMTDLVKPLLEKKLVASFPIHEYWIDIGKLEDFKQADGEYETIFGK